LVLCRAGRLQGRAVSKRDDYVAWARAQVGSNDRAGYCIKALGYDPGKGKAWCGMFCLAGLHDNGLALEHKWGIDGSGMVGPLGLKRVTFPEPGDIGYQDSPYQHHFIVVEVGNHTLTSVDGNQGVPGVQERHRALPNPHLAFFSIDPLLRSDTEPAPPSAHPTLKLGSTGPDVAELQRILNAHSGAQLVVDGKFGPVTALAVQALQRRAGLDADGIVGPKTWQVLEHLT
jgi:hypothetical protein